MSRVRYTAEFKAEAVKQVTERGLVSLKSQSDWAYQTRAYMSG